MVGHSRFSGHSPGLRLTKVLFLDLIWMHPNYLTHLILTLYLTQPFWTSHWEFTPLIYMMQVTSKKRTRRVAIKKTGLIFQCIMTSFYKTCTTTSSIFFEASVSRPICQHRSTTVVPNWQTFSECDVTKQIVTRMTSRLSCLFSVCSPNHVERHWT